MKTEKDKCVLKISITLIRIGNKKKRRYIAKVKGLLGFIGRGKTQEDAEADLFNVIRLGGQIKAKEERERLELEGYKVSMHTLHLREIKK